MNRRPKPALSFWQIWNMCFGFLGIQFGFALQNANVSRIFQTLGAELDQIPILWIAAPLTGLIVQPIVGYYSDRTWTRLGRRRPYFLFGALAATLALFLMPNSSALWMAAGLLWILDASINVSMEPFRAYVGDQLPLRQRASGYAMQSFFIGVGSVIASALPWVLTELGVANTAAPGEIPDTVKYAFYFGGCMLLGAVSWTVFSTREYPPDQLHNFDDAGSVRHAPFDPSRSRRDGTIWLAGGVVALAAIYLLRLDPQLYLLAGGVSVYGLALLVLAASRSTNLFTAIMTDVHDMPDAMRRLAVVQFFSWFTLFTMFVYTAPAVARLHFGASGPGTDAYEAGANWAGVLFATYNGLAAFAALFVPAVVRRFGMRMTHRINLWTGAAGLLSMVLIRDPAWLLASMAGLGLAWASIISLPYAMLANNLPSRKMGVNIGIFNIFIVIPQLLAVSVIASLLDLFADGDPAYALVIGAVGWFLAGWAVMRVRETA